MLTREEQQQKDEVIAFTEDILRAKGIECDSKISRISQEQLEVIFEKLESFVRRRMKMIKTDKISLILPYSR